MTLDFQDRTAIVSYRLQRAKETPPLRQAAGHRHKKKYKQTH